jgi:hypothetical protein
MWDGKFLPMQKSVETVRFIPLLEMEEDDWRILEYERLRSVAKNRISSMIFEGTLIGFFRVDVLNKAKAKPNYYWPGSAEMLKRFQETRDHDFFRNREDDDFDSDRADQVSTLVGIGGTLSPAAREALVRWMGSNLLSEQEAERLRQKLSTLSPPALLLLIVILLLRNMNYEQAEELILEERF